MSDGMLPALTSARVEQLNASFFAANSGEEHLRRARKMLEEPGSFTNGGPRVIADLQRIGETAVAGLAANRSAGEVDAEAAVELYSAFEGLDRSSAADARLWNRLACVEFGEYAVARWAWPERGSSTGKHRFVLPLGIAGARPLERHAVSRLWWTAHLFRDQELHLPASRASGDQFAMVRLAFENENLRAEILGRSTALASPAGLAGQLLAWSLRLEGATDGAGANTRSRTREFFRNVQTISGYTAIDSMSFEQREELFESLVGASGA